MKKAALFGCAHITLGDVCEVFAPPELLARIKSVKLVATKGTKKQAYVISSLDMVKAIDESLPGHTISNLGEKDTVVLYRAKKPKDVAWWSYIKIAVLGIVFAVGASTAIMSFHNDAEIPKVFTAYHKMLTGESTDKPRVLQVSYAIGLATGIIVFFNNIGGRKLKSDPSPIEVEMTDYDKTVTETLVEFLSVEKRKEGNG